MLPKACGGWYHMPTALSCAFSPALLLDALGGRNGQICKHNPYFWHWRPAPKWVVRYRQDGFVLFDEQHRARLDFSDAGERPTLQVLPFYRCYASCEKGPPGWSFVHAYVVDQDGVEYYRTFTLHRRARVHMGTLTAAAHQLATLVAERIPDITDPLAYW